MMRSEELAEIKKRAEAATPGPWKAGRSGVETEHPEHQALSHWYGGTCNEVCSFSDGGEYIDNMNGDNDANFIAHAREDVPKLLAEIERLEGVQKRLSTSYIELFINYVELMDESMPSWRYYASDKISQLLEAIKNDSNL